ncbi:DoxX family protein [Streptomyces zingiberis]|uniref:DoxX family protein n=1 Tax=Streptomyces zingiberis TaxID=2053010 RepID=A0ABX1C9H4_9ACTN|nr:DoxX family protein [Streptomyces zingiberis]NJQ03589.1 DoxX family protein [Streptomyces zingiberis]
MNDPRPEHLITPGERRDNGTSGPLGDGSGYVLALFRMVVGFLFACHGAATLFDVLGGPHGGPVPEPGAWPGWWAAVIQLVGGGLVVIGAWTRSAATLCSGSMAYAYFVQHQATALFPMENGGEAAAMFCWAFLLIAVMGPGRWALDALFTRAGGTTEGNRERNALAV